MKTKLKKYASTALRIALFGIPFAVWVLLVCAETLGKRLEEALDRASEWLRRKGW